MSRIYSKDLLSRTQEWIFKLFNNPNKKTKITPLTNLMLFEKIVESIIFIKKSMGSNMEKTEYYLFSMTKVNFCFLFSVSGKRYKHLKIKICKFNHA